MSTKPVATVQLGGFSTLLTVLFIGLKLTDKIDWSWWQVLAPLWAPPVFFLSLFLIFAGIGVATGGKATRK